MKKNKLKIIGEIILVLSFLTQTLLFDYYDDKSRALDESFQKRSLIDKGAELKELKYFIADFPTDSLLSKNYRKLNINTAAQKVAQSESIQIIGSNKTENEKKYLLDTIFKKAQKVNSFPEYMELMMFINSNSISAPDIINNIVSINTSKTLWRKIFIGLYILGSILLVISIKNED